MMQRMQSPVKLAEPIVLYFIFRPPRYFIRFASPSLVALIVPGRCIKSNRQLGTRCPYIAQCEGTHPVFSRTSGSTTADCDINVGKIEVVHVIIWIKHKVEIGRASC